MLLSNAATGAGEAFYRSLGLPWLTDLAEHERVAGGLVWAFGELSVLVLIVVSFVL